MSESLRWLEGMFGDKVGRLFENLFRLWTGGKELQLMNGMVTEIRIKGPKQTGGDVLIVVKCRDGNKRFVAFHSGPDAATALGGALDKIQADHLKWREDKYHAVSPE